MEPKTLAQFGLHENLRGPPEANGSEWNDDHKEAFLNNLSDKDLALAIQSANQQNDKKLVRLAGNCLFTRLQSVVLGWLHRLPDHVREDVAQEFWLRICTSKLKDYDSTKGELRPYLYRIAQNAGCNSYQEVVNLLSLDEDGCQIASNKATPYQVAEAADEWERCQRAMEQLGSRACDIVMLRVRGLDNPEIAKKLGLTVGNVGGIYHRALVKLKKILQGSN